MTRLSRYALALFVIGASSGGVEAFLGGSTKAAFTTTRSKVHQLCMASSTLTKLPESAVEIKLQIPGEATKAAYDKACRDLSKQISIPGFRKGSKIPGHILEQNMAAKGGRNALRIEAINSLLSKLIESAIKDEHGLEPIGQPSLVIPAEELANDFEPGADLELAVKCDVWPEIHWSGGDDSKPYLGLTGSYKRKPFDQKKLDNALNELQERYATLSPAPEGTSLGDGDACRVNMVGYMANEDGTKGDPLPNAASGDNVEVIIGKGRYMEGLVEGIMGAKVGDTREISVSFPVNLRDKTLAGKKAIFDIEILEASHRTLPEVTDEFANQVRAGLTAEGLMAELRKAVDSEDAKEFTPARNKALSEALSQVLEVEVPDTLVTNQAKEKFALMMTEMRDNGVSDEEIKKQINPDNFLKYKKIVKDNIVRDFKVSMAADEIARMEGIEVPDYQVQEQLAKIKKDAADSKEEFDEAMLRGKVETTIQRQMVFDFLAENAKLEVEYDNEEFDEALMSKLAEESLERERKFAAEAEGKTTAEVSEAAAKETAKLEAEAAAAEAAAEAKMEAAEAAEAAAPVEEPVAEAAAPVEEPAAEAATPVEEPATEAAAPVEEPAAEAAAPVEEPAEEAAPVEEPVAEAAPPAEPEPAPAPAPVASTPSSALEQPKSENEEAQLASKYAAIDDVGDRCFEVLSDLGMLDGE